jgi:hypothetical protein
VARSFRPLTPQQRRSIRVRRLQIATALAGESLQQLAERTGNQWNLQETAVMNDLFADATLVEGQLVKIVISVPYAADPGASSAGPAGAAHSTAMGLDQAAPPSF